MVWLTRDFDLISLLLRALVFSAEALTLGGLAFVLIVLLPLRADARRACRLTGWAALGLLVAEAIATAAGAAELATASALPLSSVLSAGFVRAGALEMAAAAALLLLLWRRRQLGLGVVPAALVLAGSVATSHAAAQMDHRWLLVGLTAMHHLGSAGWLGAMAYLWVELRDDDSSPSSLQIVRRYSALALCSVLLLVGAGAGMSWLYVGSWPAAYGTFYGLLLAVKILLTLAMLLLGAGNFLLLRGTARPLLAQLRRVSEAEIGLGFTILLAAASLTSQTPAGDVPQQERATPQQLVERLHWIAPRLSSPSAAALTPPATTMAQALHNEPGVSDATDRAWSEYNHHWAGLVVLAAGALALLGRAGVRPFGRVWPLLFLGLAVFIVLRADPEAWPLGPRGFWESFAEPDALEHRLEAALIAAFALFEWAVRSGRLRSASAACVFPLVCAGGGALLLTHAHSMGDAREDLLASLSHAAIALLGIGAGWSRWLELRGAGGRLAAIAAWTWPLCLLLAGAVLLDYRES